MKQKLIVEFTKMNGAGNDFIVIDNRFYHFSDDELASIARAFCPRRVGIGADGILALSRPTDEAAHFRMRYLNADGSVATMCGNGARCLARFARLGGIEAEPLTFETDAGLHTASVPDPSLPEVVLNLPNPKDFRKIGRDQIDGPEMYFIWTGTEHVVQFVDALDSIDVTSEGRTIRNHEHLAPQGANVNFVEVVDEHALRIRTYEKGVEEETAACGTGAAAAAVTALRTRRISYSPISVHAPGGKLLVMLEEEKEGGEVTNVRLSGPAEIVYRGTFEWD